jgi:PAS domain S-box-containing protein
MNPTLDLDPPGGSAGSSAPPAGAQAAEWLAGGGTLGELVRATDWSSTPLGPRERWPQSLRTAASLVVEGKPPMALFWGLELYVLYNDAYAAILADRHPLALGRPARELWPELWHRSEPRMSAVLRLGEAVFHEDLRFVLERRGRQEEAFFTVAETPVRVEDGSIGGVLLALQETTATHERARLLRESEARFRGVIESSRDGINLLDLATGRYVFMSPAQIALTGFTAEEMNDLPAEEAFARIHPDDRHIFLEQQRRLAAGEELSDEPAEYRWKVKSGEYRWFSDHRGLVRDEAGRPTALVGISRDITERRRAEDALRASQQMYAAIFERSPFALALSTLADGAIVAVNDAFLQMFELARDDAVGKRSTDLGIVDEDTRDQARAELAARGRVHDFECVRRTASGAPRHLSLSIDRVSIGGVPHTLTTIQDIAARREAEAAKQLAQRTQALDELKTRFFASISHEFRTPLALILGPTEQLLQAPDTAAAVRRDLAVVQRNARTLLGLVDNLLDLAKLEAGRMTAAYAEADLAELARLVAGHFEVLCEDQRIAFAVEAPPRLPAQLDPEQIRRVLLNLLSNAFKFTPPGGRVRLVLREAQGRARVEVADSGPGIPADQREAVFERFGPAAATEPRRHAGTGLGLAIVRDLVQLHGGTISIADAPEGGALIAVELPRAAPPGVAVRPADEQVYPPALARPLGALPALPALPAEAAPVAAAGAGPLVLVVEDNPEMSRFIARSLSERYRVVTAADGEAGLARAAALRPDLILCDLMMPELGGEQMVLEVRRRPELDATPIVVLSARADDEVRVRLLREGAQDYLTKPFSVEELRARVGNLVAHKLAEQATRRAETKYRGIISTAADAIISTDEQYRITEWNRAAEQMFGYSRAEAIGTPLARLLPERHHEAYRERVERLFARSVERPVADPGASRRLDHSAAVGLRRTGEEFPIGATISSLELEGERILTLAIRDISEEKRGEDEQRVLAEIGGTLASLEYDAPLQELARVVAGSIGDYAVIFVAEDGGALHRAAAASRDPAYAWAADFMLELPPAPDPAHPVWQVLAGRSPIVIELAPERYEAIARSAEHLRVPHAARPRHAMVVPLLGIRQCVGVLGIAAAKRELDPRDLRLAQEVARRCALFIENARLHRAERRATQARDEMLGVVAHDLRNPLNNIALFAARLGATAGSSPAAKHAGVIERNAARMNRIIEDLLDVAQLEMGQLKVTPARVSARDLVADVGELWSAQVAERSIALQLDAAEGLPEVWADRDRTLQVFENLIGNALKFTQRGTISVGARPSGREIQFWVADTGPGIAAEDLPHVFDRFWQAHRGGRRGTAGLGLAIVKGIIEAQAGRVWVESEVDAGSTFFFTVPAA